MLDYAKGAEHCKRNSERLQASAEILLKNNNGTDSFGMFLYYISYEEMAKAVYCLFVHRRLVDENFIEPVFGDHKYKIILYDEIIKSFKMENGVYYFGGKELGEISLETLVKNHNIKKYRNITNDFLYVGKDSNWKIPKLKNTEKDKLREVKNKLDALHNFFEFFHMEHDKTFKTLSNFKFKRNTDGTFTMISDASR